MVATTKRYLVFAYDSYYPSGGWGDHRGSFETKDEAVAKARELSKKYDHNEVIDVETGISEEY